MTGPEIDPALGIELTPERTLESNVTSASVVIPAHNEADTITQVVLDAKRGLDKLAVSGEVWVSASDCHDDTSELALEAGARVIETPAGKGAALAEGVKAAKGDVIVTIDGDIQYFGNPPLSTLLAEPIVHGLADACVSDLYWRPLYPQLWLHGFFAPLAGALYPEMLSKVGSTPWSGQRAARRELWPEHLPADFTVDLELLLHWNRHATRLRPVLADDWVNPQRPKPDLMGAELDVLIEHAITDGRLSSDKAPKVRAWFEEVHAEMATYRPEEDDPQKFEHELLSKALSALHRNFQS